MIEFKGIYYTGKAVTDPQSVLVQFDGVLLHVWHMSNPFHRLLTSDVFRLPSTTGGKTRCIKLPNGDRIETDNMAALNMIRSKQRALAGRAGVLALAKPPSRHILLYVLLLLLGLSAIKIWL